MKNSAFRALVILIGLTLFLSLLNTSGAQRKPNAQTKSQQPQSNEGPCPEGSADVDAPTARERLKAGNKQWQSRMAERNWSEEREETRCGQHPYAVVLTCMDSRVPPELIFDRGLGEIFVIRVAGPVANSAAVLNSADLASLEYALVKLKVKLVLVLGHTDCGAVKSAVQGVSGHYLPHLFRKIQPAITHVKRVYNRGRDIDPDDHKNLDRVSLFNAKFVHSELLVNPEWRRQPGLQVNWGLYYLSSGKVAFDPTDVQP